MTESTSYAVHRLTERWTLILPTEGYAAREFPPLLEILESLVGSSNNTRGGGGLAHTRNLLDTKALDLLMHIQDVAGAWLFEWDVIVTAPGIAGRVGAFADRLETLWRGGSLPERNYVNLSANLERWAVSIWNLYEPPARVPLRQSACPSCHRAKVTNDAGDETDALVVTFGDAGEPRADCQWADCGAVWAGAESLIALGDRIGATLDPEALREMGVIA